MITRNGIAGTFCAGLALLAAPALAQTKLETGTTSPMPAEFQRRRSYDENQRVLTNYRETISELLLENYTKTWGAWAKTHDAQAELSATPGLYDQNPDC